MKVLLLLLAVAALAGCVTAGSPREARRERSQDVLRPSRPNDCLRGIASILDAICAKNT